MAVFYPQAALTLRIVWEDFGISEPIVGANTVLSDEGLKQAQLEQKLNKIYRFPVLAKNVRVNINDYTKADTFDATIDYKNFPFDPRVIRALGVTVHIEDRGQIFQVNNQLDLLKPSVENTVFQGFADTENISMDETDRTVRIEGRDFTALLIDRQYFGGPIAHTKPIDKVLEELLAQLPELAFNPSNPDARQGLILDNRTGAALPTLSQLYGGKQPEQEKKNQKRKQSYWDVIQKIISLSGLIAYIELDRLVITKPRNLYNLEGKEKLFIFGKNVTNLDFKRKIGRQKGFNVRVLSVNIEDKALIDVKIPEDATQDFVQRLGIKKERIKLPTVKADGTKAENQESKPAPFFTFRIADLKDRDQAVAMGEEIFEEISRQELEGSLTTNEMTLCETDGKTIFDATKFRNGTPITIEIDQGDMRDLDMTASKAQIKKFLIKRCYEPAVAEALAASLKKINTPFYTRSVELVVDQEQGFALEVDFINYIDLDQKVR